MYEINDDILVINFKGSTYFFDPSEVLIFLKDKNISVREMISEYKRDRLSFPKDKRRENFDFENCIRPSIELHVTNDCNLRCKYCYLNEVPHEEANEMKEEVIEKAFLLAKKLFPNASEYRISLYGGEPLLFKKFDFLIKTAKKILQRFHICLATNGTVLNDEILKLLKENNISFQISWDGAEENQNALRPTRDGRGSYALIDRNISRFKMISNRLSVRSTVTPYNVNLLEQFLFFKEKGIKKISFCLCTSSTSDLTFGEKDIPNLKEKWNELAAFYLKHLIGEEEIINVSPFFRIFKILHFRNKKYSFCNSVKNFFAVSSEGNIYSCHRFIGNEKYRIGDLGSGIDKSLPAFQEIFNFNVEKENACESCFAKYTCAGGCHHEKSLSFLNVSCPITRHILALSVWIYSELLSKHPLSFKKLEKALEKHLDFQKIF